MSAEPSDPQRSPGEGQDEASLDRESSALIVPSVADLFSSLQRVERTLGEIAVALDLLARERQHKTFSPIRLVGGVVQVLALALLVLAAMDWLLALQIRPAMWAKLVFAVALQLLALTAFFVAQRE